MKYARNILVGLSINGDVGSTCHNYTPLEWKHTERGVRLGSMPYFLDIRPTWLDSFSSNWQSSNLDGCRLLTTMLTRAVSVGAAPPGGAGVAGGGP